MLCLYCNGEIRPWGVCTCCEKKLHQEIGALKGELMTIKDRLQDRREICDIKDAQLDKLEAMLWMSYRKSGSPLQYRDWRQLMSEEKPQNESA